MLRLPAITLNSHKDEAIDTPLVVRLAAILLQIQSLADKPDIRVLEDLLATLQSGVKDTTTANHNMAIFVYYVRDNPELATGLSLFLLNLIHEFRQVSLYTDAGILSDNSFLAEFYGLIGHRILPRLPDDGALIELLSRLVSGKTEQLWLQQVSYRWWYELLLLLHIPIGQASLMADLKESLLKSIVILSYRISGIGLHPELIRSYPQATATHSAFIAQNTEVNTFVEHYREHHLILTTTKQNTPPDNTVKNTAENITEAVDGVSSEALFEERIDASQIFVLLDQCDQVADGIRRRVYKNGISIRLTNMLVRLEQSVKRLELLVLLLSANPHEQKKALMALIVAFVKGAQHRHSLSYLVNTSTQLLSRKVTENASKVGEHYISTDTHGYKHMYQKAALGGFLIAFMATLKILSYGLELAPIARAFVNSMIYGLGFVLIHIIGGTVATKQPAMTAAAIASTISETTSKKISKLNKLAELIVDIMRTQFVAILGNITIAMPIAFLISLAWWYGTGKPLVDLSQSEHLLHDLNPFTSLALPHAAIAGVFLYFSGLVAGYYDNMAVHHKIGERIRRHPTLRFIFPSALLAKISQFIEQNLGALMSNFIFGVCLGSTATVGFILGLPLDIRHIAFSSANLVHGIFNTYANTGNLPEISVMLISFLGMLMIGSINLMVSFTLALITALRARGVKWFEWSGLVSMVGSHFAHQPLDFFIPRKQPMHYARIDSDGNIIHDDMPQQKPAPPKQDLLTLPIGIGALQKGEKLSPQEIEEKKQAIKEKLEKTQTDDSAKPSPAKLPK